MDSQIKEILDEIEAGEELTCENAVILFDNKNYSVTERIFILLI